MEDSDHTSAHTARSPSWSTGFRSGDSLALARCITRVENQSAGFEDLLHEFHDGVGRARRTGITGPPGAGKSTLTAVVARHLRDRGETVGIVAVDPSSPFTGGALLGDRVRMDDLATEPGSSSAPWRAGARAAAWPRRLARRRI